MKKSKKPIRNAKVKAGKVRKLRILQKKSDEAEPVVEDKFIDESTQLNVESIQVAQPAEWDVRDELEQMDGFRDYLQESRGSTLSYGDY